MRMVKKIISFLLVAALVAGMIPAILSTASAAGTSYQLATLLTEGKIKPLGRTAVNLLVFSSVLLSASLFS